MEDAGQMMMMQQNQVYAAEALMAVYANRLIRQTCAAAALTDLS